MFVLSYLCCRFSMPRSSQPDTLVCVHKSDMFWLRLVACLGSTRHAETGEHHLIFLFSFGTCNLCPCWCDLIMCIVLIVGKTRADPVRGQYSVYSIKRWEIHNTSPIKSTPFYTVYQKPHLFAVVLESCQITATGCNQIHRRLCQPY